MTRARTFEPIGLLLLFLFALGLRLAGAGWGLPQLYEEATPLKVAWTLWAWGSPHGFDGNPHTLGYPSLVFYVHFLGQLLLFGWLKLTGAIHSTSQFRMLYALDKTSFALVGRAISALFGAGLVPATYALTRRMAGAPAGWAAALLVALAPALVQRATEIEVDLPLAFFVTWGCVQALTLSERVTLRNGVMAGLFVGLAASSKYPGFILFVPCIAAILLAPRASFEPAAPIALPAVESRRARGSAARAAVTPGASATGTLALRARVLLVVLATGALVFCLTSPYVLLDRTGLARDLAKESEHMAQGHFGVASGPAFLYNLSALAERLLGWPLALLSLAGVGVLALRQRQREALVAASLPLAYLVVVGMWTMKADRYLLLVMPVAIAFATALAAWIIARCAGITAGRTRSAVAWTLLVATCVVPFALQYAHGEFFARFLPDTRTEALHWIRRNAPEGAFIAVEQAGPDLANFTSPELMEEVVPHMDSLAHRPRFYAVQFVPMFQVEAERSAAFYNLALYRSADLFLITGAVRARYEADRVRYARQCAFYDSLDRHWPVAAHFVSARHAGPEIYLYRNPDHAGWFATRPDVPGPVPAGKSESGMENFFYWNMGVNYETSGRFDRAIEAYRIALHYAPRSTDTELYASIATRLVYCLLQSSSPQQTFTYLQSAEGEASLEIEHGVLRWVMGQLAQDPSQFAKLAIPRLRG